MCGISYEDSKILSSTLKDSQRTITSVQLSFKERVPTLTLNPNTFNRWKLSNLAHNHKTSSSWFSGTHRCRIPKQTQNPFKLRKRFTSGGLVQGKRANTDPKHNTFKGSNWVRTMCNRSQGFSSVFLVLTGVEFVEKAPRNVM